MQTVWGGGPGNGGVCLEWCPFSLRNWKQDHLLSDGVRDGVGICKEMRRSGIVIKASTAKGELFNSSLYYQPVLRNVSESMTLNCGRRVGFWKLLCSSWSTKG